MITISGVIGETYTYTDLLADVMLEKEKNIVVEINSPGGYTRDGIAMYYLLQDLKDQGFTVTTIARNECASIATIVFVAGTKRIAYCPLMIHNPWGTVTGDAAALEQYMKECKAVEKELESIYQANSKLNAETLSQLMDVETYITPAQAVAFGLATEAGTQVKALFNNTNLETMAKESNEKASKFKTWLAEQRKTLGLDKPKDDKSKAQGSEVKSLDLETVEGTVLIVERESGMPQEGDAASPDGTWTLPDGTVVTVADGVVTSVVEADGSGAAGEVTADEVQTLEEAQEVIETLLEEITALKAQVKTTEEKQILNMVKMAGGAEKVFAGKTGAYKFSARTQAPNIGGATRKQEEPEKTPFVSKLEAERAKAKERMAKKYKN